MYSVCDWEPVQSTLWWFSVFVSFTAPVIKYPKSEVVENGITLGHSKVTMVGKLRQQELEAPAHITLTIRK